VQEKEKNKSKWNPQRLSQKIHKRKWKPQVLDVHRNQDHRLQDTSGQCISLEKIPGYLTMLRKLPNLQGRELVELPPDSPRHHILHGGRSLRTYATATP
jgi:hypothetical protein